MEEMIEVQTVAEVQQIDEKKALAEALDTQINEQTNHMEIISDQLSSISDTMSTIEFGNVDLTEVTDKLDELDTAMLTTQNQDILETVITQQNQVNNIEQALIKQQNQINSIEETLNSILEIVQEMKQ